MAKKFYYTTLRRMTPKNGTSFSTTYIDQETVERERMAKTLEKYCEVLIEQTVKDPLIAEEFNKPVPKMKKKTDGTKRTYFEVITDMIGECRGKTKQGIPKDFAMAPIERWNDAFPEEFQIELEKGYPQKNNFNSLFDPKGK